MAKKQLLLFIILAGLLVATVVLAEEFTSTNFIDSNPVVTLGGGKSTSTNFQLFSGAGQFIIGESSSSAFIGHAGFFYFPFVSTPVLSVTAGDSQASLTWTSAIGELGFNITAYAVGQSANSGGPFTFTNVGNVLNKTVTGLTNGSTYYFVVRALDFLGDSVATSTQVSVTLPTIIPPIITPPSEGGVGVIPTQTTVIFSGFAYPNSVITLLQDAQIVATTVAGADAVFQIIVSGIAGGNYIFSIYAEDSKGVHSPLLSFPISAISGKTTQVGGVLIPPTISVDKSEVKRGDKIGIFGQSIPQSEITIVVSSKKDFFAKTVAGQDGNYLYNFDTKPLSEGQYFAKSKFTFFDKVSPFSKSVDFFVGTKNVEVEPTPKCPIKADLNNDCRVNLVDVSILIYWFDKTSAPEKVDLDGNRRVDLVDLSILAYYWTG